MGKSKSNTGIKIVDDLTDTAVNAVTRTAKNAEKNIGQDLKESAYALGKGDFNGFGNSMLESALGNATFHQFDMTKTNVTGQTGTERALSEATKKAETSAADAAVKKQNLTLDGIRSTISGQIGARMRAPGRGMTLLNGNAGRANTLLTIAGG